MLLTITASNRDRFNPTCNSTKLFLDSLRRQTDQRFNFLIADGGSANINDIIDFCKSEKDIHIDVVQYSIGEKFERARLNNVGIRHAKTPFIMTTDVDMFFASDFVEEILSILTKNPVAFIESRTMYWKQPVADKIYKGELNPWNDLESCKIGRIKKRTTAGGCQCTFRSNWHKVRGFDERYIGWGSEDYDLLTRMSLAKIKIVWMGESRETIKVFHQPHKKNDIKGDLIDQENNKKILNTIKQYRVNPEGWGGMP